MECSRNRLLGREGKMPDLHNQNVRAIGIFFSLSIVREKARWHFFCNFGNCVFFFLLLLLRPLSSCSLFSEIGGKDEWRKKKI